MNTVKVELVIGCINTMTNEVKFLINNQELPLKTLDVSKQPNEIAKEILDECAVINPDWPEHKLLKCYTISEELRIVYCVTIPYNIKLKNGEWYDVEKINSNCDELIQSLVYEASLKI